MALNSISQANFTTGILVADTLTAPGGSSDSIQTVIAPSTSLEIRSTLGALLISRMTQAEINALTATNGMMVYNITTGLFNVYANGAWVNIGGNTGTGDVVGPSNSIQYDVPIFADTSGKVLLDSGVNISDITPPLFTIHKSSLADIINLSGIGSITFENSDDFGYFFVGSSLIYTISYDSSSSTNSTVFTDGVQLVPTNESCLVELTSTTGSLVLSRMSTIQQNNLNPTNGMILYNNDTGTIDAYIGGQWLQVSGDVVGPATATTSGIAVFEGTSGKVIESTDVIIDAFNNLYTSFNITAQTIVAGTAIGLPTNSSVALEVQTTDGAFLISRLTQTEINALTPLDGMMVYNTTTNQFNVYQGGEWLGIAGSGSVTEIGTGTGLTGGPITTSGTISIANTGVVAGEYTSVSNIVINAQGQITSVENGTGATVTSVGISGSTGLTVSGSPITTSGVIELTLSNDLQGISSIEGTGIVVRQTTGGVYQTRIISPGSGNIVVSNGDGVDGNPIINIASNLFGINSILVGNLSLAANTISSTNSNGNIVLDANGLGAVVIDNLTLVGSTISSNNNLFPNINIQPASGGSVNMGALSISGDTITNTTLFGSGSVLLTPTGSGAIIIDELSISGNTIASNVGFGNIIIAPDGGELQCFGDINIQEDNYLKLSSGGAYVGFKAGIFPTDIIWSLPDVDGEEGQALVTNGALELSWGSSGANDEATFIIQTRSGLGMEDLPNAQALDQLVIPDGAAGILKTNIHGVVAIAVPDVDYATDATLVELAAEAAASAAAAAGSATTASDAAIAAGISAAAASADAAAIAGVAGAQFILQTPKTGLPNAQSLGDLTTGIVLNTVTSSVGVLSTAVAGTDYYAPGFPTYLKDSNGIFYNVFVGTNAGNTSVTGSYNTGVGIGALHDISGGSNSSAFGYEALSSATSGESNTAIGSNSLISNNGSNNTAVGYMSGASYSTYTNCTIIGCNADTNSSGLTNAIAIGYNTKVSVSNAAVIGTNCYVGIANSSPAYSLDIGNISSQCAIQFANSTSTPTTPSSGFGIVYVSSNDLFFANSTNTYNLTTGIAPYSATYILQTVDSSLPSAQSLGALTTGLLLNTVTSSTGVLSTATPGVNYYAPGFPTTLLDTTGTKNNLFVGTSAGNTSLTGTHNTAFGLGSEIALTSGVNNAALGYQTLQSITTSSNCTAIGNSALSTMTSGSGVTALGSAAGTTHGVTSYTNCTFLGFNADVSTGSLTNSTAIGYNSTVSVSDAVVLGSGCYVGIGNSSPAYTLDLGNISSECAIRFANSTSTPSAPGSGFGILYASSDTLFYVNDVTTYNLNLVVEDDSADNLFVGSSCGNTTLTGSTNFGMGLECMSSITSGSDNVAMGFKALTNVSTSSDNIAIGYDCLSQLTTGTGRNIAIGSQALGALVNDADCVGIGYNSLIRASTCSGTTAIGSESGQGQSSYTNCTFLGFGADALFAGLTNAIAIGYNTLVNTSNSLILGNGCNVGIGTGSPAASLTVIGGQIVNVTLINTDYSALSTDYIIGCSGLTAPITITIPDASSGIAGQIYIVKDEDGAANINTITIQTVSMQYIDGNTSFIINFPYQSTSLYNDGNQWYIW